MSPDRLADETPLFRADDLNRTRLLPPYSIAEHLGLSGIDPTQLRQLLTELRPRPLEAGQVLVLSVLAGRGETSGLVLKGTVTWSKTAFTLTREETEQLKEKVNLAGLGGAVIFVDDIRGEEIITGIANALSEGLPEKGKIWVLERQPGGLNEEEPEARVEFLQSRGFVECKVVSTKGGDFFLWYGRREKKRESSGVDLTAKPWYGRAKKLMVDGYLRVGWRSVDATEIDDRCAHSRFPPGDYRKLIDGLGVRLTAPCGCEWVVSGNGTLTRDINCPGEDCSGFPPVPSQAEARPDEVKIGYGIPTGQVCGKRGDSPTFYNRIVLGEGPRGVRILEETYCPHCGLVEPTETFSVPRGKIRTQ
ncbi:hypothetical protein FJZ40_04330 [Candidatus Shapirobacteria bacterium]|nr:hypothetical protein [Candidatus Shapirobacteria bacterium]